MVLCYDENTEPRFYFQTGGITNEKSTGVGAGSLHAFVHGYGGGSDYVCDGCCCECGDHLKRER